MKGSHIEVGRIYFAYCGSLVPVRVIQTQVPYAFPGQVAPKRQGVLVRTLTPVPDASDWDAARQERREPATAHQAGEEFVVPARDVGFAADRDVVPDAVHS